MSDHPKVDRKAETVKPLTRIALQLDDETARMLNDAERAIRSFEYTQDDPMRAKAMSDACLHIESIANIKMTGKQTTARKAFRTAVQRSSSAATTNSNEKSESLRNTDALITASELGRAPISPEAFAEIHRRLLTNTTRDSYKGLLRENSKHIGGSRYHEFGTPYRMPEPNEIPALLNDLAVFCNRETLPAIAQAALAHVQFIAVHPYARANGKTARALIQLILQRRGLIADAIVPLSLPMVTSSHDYQKGVIATMQNFLQDNPDPREINSWLRYFSTCCIRAVDEAKAFDAKTFALQELWLSRLGSRSDSAATLLIRALPGMPVFTATTASAYIDRSFKRVTAAIDELLCAGVIIQITKGKRNRVFECPEIVEAYADITGFQ